MERENLKQQFEDGGIDAGLLMLVATTSPDRAWTHRDIAYVCGCSRGLIWFLEQSAKRKLRKALARQGHRDMRSIMSASNQGLWKGSCMKKLCLLVGATLLLSLVSCDSSKPKVYLISHKGNTECPVNTKLAKDYFTPKDGSKQDACILNEGLPYDYELDYLEPGESTSISIELEPPPTSR